MKLISRKTWNPGVKILDRYVAREFLISFGIALAVVLLLRMLLDLFLGIDEFLETKNDDEVLAPMMVVSRIVRYYWPRLFLYFREFSGVVIMLAATFSMTRMTRNNELTAVLASGVSLKRMIVPVVLLAMGFNLLMAADQELVLPRLADDLNRKQDEVDERGLVYFWLVPDEKGNLVSSLEFLPDEKAMQKVHILLREEGRLAGQIFAARADWLGDGRWRLTDGILRTEKGDQPVMEYSSTLTPEYLWLQRNSNYKTLMSFTELNQLLGHLSGAEYAEAVSERNFRFTDPIINMVMLLLGLPLLVSRERRNTPAVIGMVLLGAGGCFVATFVCKLFAGDVSLANNPFTPLLVAWLPIIVFLPLSILVLDSMKT
ncbi:MAG: LptF/LptG family permease [Sedimentisphaerales bacterium]|nr:LptF/LptG family permease [Sedimentisphaerales bacterium]